MLVRSITIYSRLCWNNSCHEAKSLSPQKLRDFIFIATHIVFHGCLKQSDIGALKPYSGLEVLADALPLGELEFEILIVEEKRRLTYLTFELPV